MEKTLNYYPELGHMVGVKASLVISQALEWTRYLPNKNKGWFCRTREDWESSLGLTRREQETARRKLVSLGILEEKLQGMPARLWFRIDSKRLIKILIGRRKQPNILYNRI